MANLGAVVVTGASTGIGEACARALAESGFRVFATVRRREDADRLARAAPGIEPEIMDVTRDTSIESARRRIGEALGDQPLAGLVNNAGVACPGPLEFLPVEDLRRQLEVNVIGQVAVTQAFLPLLRRARGRIVFMGSIAGRMAVPFLGAYAASKFALEALSDSWRVELAPWGLHVALVEPGDIRTPIWDKGVAAGDALTAKLPQEAHRLYGAAAQAVRRMGAATASRGAPTSIVTRAVVHALTASAPHTRYLVGSDAWARSWVALLPDRWRDALVRRAMRLPDVDA